MNCFAGKLSNSQCLTGEFPRGLLGQSAEDSVSSSTEADKTEVDGNPPDEQIYPSPDVTTDITALVENPVVSTEDLKAQNSERVLSAEAVAAALTQAAEAAAGGDIGSEEAGMSLYSSICPAAGMLFLFPHCRQSHCKGSLWLVLSRGQLWSLALVMNLKAAVHSCH